MRPRFAFAAVVAVVLPLAFTSANADPLFTEASDNATVQPGGPRSGSSGKAFFNVEGSGNGSFASYGVADFNFGNLLLPVLSINSMSISLTQANAAFSTTGPVQFSVDQSATLADIQPGGTSPLAFDGAEPGTATDVGQSDLDLLALGGGPFVYTVGTTGDVDNYPITLDAAVTSELISRLNNGETIRIVVGTGAASLAATWAGYTNSTWAGPTLNLDVSYDTGTPAKPTSWGRVKALYR